VSFSCFRVTIVWREEPAWRLLAGLSSVIIPQAFPLNFLLILIYKNYMGDGYLYIALTRKWTSKISFERFMFSTCNLFRFKKSKLSVKGNIARSRKYILTFKRVVFKLGIFCSLLLTAEIYVKSSRFLHQCMGNNDYPT
jgi:hypothetical protein